MLHRPLFLALMAASLTIFSACAPFESPKPQPSEVTPKPSRPSPHLTGDAGGVYRAQKLTGDFRGYPAAEAFIDRMVESQGFSRDYLYGLLSQAKRKTWTIEYMNREKPTVKQKPGGWTRYRAKFLDDRHISAGAQFWSRNAEALRRAEETYGVSPEVILGIMGVETIYGANVGTHRVIDALTTLAFDYPRRAAYFESELESLLIMARQEGLDPSKPVGSFAGAMGLGQFMPSSFLKYAVDFDGNGRVDLWDPEDAIGSIAHYFASFGWKGGEPVVTRARVMGLEAESLKSGFDTRYTFEDLAAHGIRPEGRSGMDGEVSFLQLSTLDGNDYRIGYPNFYVITRYNHSTYYAMAVYELGQAIRERRQGSGR
ncbi:MAG: hypothetical protein RLZZ627_312 [Pseudomonadota bacterium]